MATVAEFVSVRQQIELLIKQVTRVTERKVVADSTMQKLEEANQLLVTLKTMVNNDVQELCVGRLTGELSRLETKAGSLTRTKKRAPQKRTAP